MLRPIGTTDTGSAHKPELSVSLHNFWRGFDAKNSFFVKALGETYDVKLSEAGRDVQISSVFGTKGLPTVGSTRPLRVWWTGEVRDPSGQTFDLYFGFRRTALLGSRWHRYPLWATYLDWWNPDALHHVERLLEAPPLRPRPRFCNFIYSKPSSIRTEFFLRLNEARRVDSMGRFLTNTEARVIGVKGKLQALQESLFTIAFENQLSPGYVTEKLLQPLIAGSIPIYWGAAEAKSDFNPDAFIFAEDFDSFDDLIAHVLKLADSPEALAEIASAPRLRDGRIAYEHTPAFLVDRITDALSGDPALAIHPHWNGPWTMPPRKPLKRLKRRIRDWTRRRACRSGEASVRSRYAVESAYAVQTRPNIDAFRCWSGTRNCRGDTDGASRRFALWMIVDAAQPALKAAESKIGTSVSKRRSKAPLFLAAL